MDVLVIGTESLGVRGLCCLVHAGQRNILIDPGVALGFLRHGRLPHPRQVAVGAAVRERIIAAFSEATDIVISHFHGDHIPCADANPFQLPLSRVPPVEGVVLWCPGPGSLSPLSRRRRADLLAHPGWHPVTADGRDGPVLTFSRPVPHGGSLSRGGVVMTAIRHGGDVFVHASDIQMLDREAVDIIRGWHPDAVIASGPPLYLDRLSPGERALAWENARLLADAVPLCILDHHLLRSRAGLGWLHHLSEETGGSVISAAAFMGRVPLLLEAAREEEYASFEVPVGWHEEYARGDAGFREFVDAGLLVEMERIRTATPVPLWE
ncbi:MAG: hypothetical protein ACP5C4_09015 [Methanomicrobiales archaeon]